MQFLFLFGLVFLSGCLHRKDTKEEDIKASKVETDNIGGGALVTPSKHLKALRLASKKSEYDDFHVYTAQTFDIQKVSSVVAQKESPQVIEARLTDIPVMIGSVLVDGAADTKNNKTVIYKVLHTGADCSSICSFYMQELERLGWQTNLQYQDEKYVCIVAKKPHKSAVFSLNFCDATWTASSYVLVRVVVRFNSN